MRDILLSLRRKSLLVSRPSAKGDYNCLLLSWQSSGSQWSKPENPASRACYCS